MNNYSGDETVNLGTGKELTIKELTELVAKVIGYTGDQGGSEQAGRNTEKASRCQQVREPRLEIQDGA